MCYACVQRPEVNVPDPQLLSAMHSAFPAGQLVALGTLTHCGMFLSLGPYLLIVSSAHQESYQSEKAFLEETVRLRDFFWVTDYSHFIVSLCLLTLSSISSNKYVLHS